MEELKEILHIIAGLPSLTVWVLVGFLVYKLAVIGSVYGTIRFGIQQFVVWRASSNTRTFRMGSRLIDEAASEALQGQIVRLASNTGYIHHSDVIRLQRAIDAMLEKEKK